jgi:DNA-directed RNA polymerase II subunit RPB1
MQIYIRSSLASKRLILHENLNVQSFDWMIGEIKSKFESGLVHPGEVVGSIAAHSLGEPAT